MKLVITLTAALVAAVALGVSSASASTSHCNIKGYGVEFTLSGHDNLGAICYAFRKGAGFGFHRYFGPPIGTLRCVFQSRPDHYTLGIRSRDRLGGSVMCHLYTKHGARYGLHRVA